MRVSAPDPLVEPDRTTRVLHVDDQTDILEVATVYLEEERESFEIVGAPSVEAGLDRLARTAFDCVVSDYDMPDRNGLEFLRQVREEYPDLPFILYTGKGSEEIASEAISAGVTDYLQKDTGTEQYTVLANRIENAVRRYRAERTANRSFRAIESAREGIALLDRDGDFLYVNEAYADVVNYDQEDLLGEHWKLLYPEDRIPHVENEILPKVAQQGRWDGETTYVRKDGTPVLVSHVLSYTDDQTMICLIQEQPDE